MKPLGTLNIDPISNHLNLVSEPTAAFLRSSQ